MNISIIGTGYVGLVTGVCFANLGHNVTCVDIDANRIEQINKGVPPIYETGLDELLKTNIDEGRFSGTTDLEEAINTSSVSFICVGTPSGLLDFIDLKYIDQVSKDIGRILKNKNEYHVVVVKSTVVPGTTRHSVLNILEQNSGKSAGKDFGVIMNPEFLREGQAIDDFIKPDRIVIGGIDEKSISIMRELYNDINAPIIETNPRTAEMIKYATNAYLATKISFINDIGNICKLLSIDSYEVARGLGMDKRVSPHYLNSGIGFGGSCFPKDVKALVGKATEVYYRPTILNAALAFNENQPLRIVELLETKVGSLKGKDIVVLGLAFKPGTDDMREAASIKIIHTLLKKGANIHATDPKAVEEAKSLFGEPKRLNFFTSPEEAVKKGKHILIVTEWDEFRKEDLYHGKIVIDGRRIEEARVADYYEGVCW